MHHVGSFVLVVVDLDPSFVDLLLLLFRFAFMQKETRWSPTFGSQEKHALYERVGDR
jgi:hypothetical protein